MSLLTRAQWEALYGTSGTVFPDNTTEEISEGDMRTFGKNLSDTYFNKNDDAYTGAKGQRAGVTAPASLKDIVTTSLSFGTMITFADSTASNVVRIYELTNETTAESSPEVIRPNDYAGTSNEKVWRLRSTTDVDSDTGGGGGGAVDSVNGQTGTVVLDASDIEYTPGGGISATDVQAAIAELDIEVDSRIDTAISGAIAGLNWKNPARVASTANGTLATAFENGDTVDGVVIATGDRIVLKNQTAQTENGVYTVNASGAPTRATDCDTPVELEGATISILEGTSNANTTWVQTTDNITLGVSNIIFTQLGVTVVDADSTTKGIAKLYSTTSLGTNNDGAPTQNAVKVYADAKVVDAINNGATTTAPSENAVFDALALKAPLASPALTGTPTAPTAAANDNSFTIATTAYADAADLVARRKSYFTTAASTNTYTATISPAIASVSSGDRFFINFTNANTAASTLNLNGLGAIAIKKNGVDALVPNDIKAGQISELVYDGTNFQLQSVATSSPTTFVTDKKRYYHGEWRVGRTINTSTGATSADTTRDVTDYIEVEPSTEIVIFTTDGSAMTVYGWTYTSAFAAISEIRSNALIGTTLTTYTFTTPSNAKYLQVYTRNGGTASEVVIGWRAVMEIQSTANITYKTPIIPEDYSGTDRQKIQAAIDFARWTASPVELNGLYLVDAAVIIRSNTKLILNGVVKGASGIRDNLFRTESAEFAPTTILNRATRNFYIKGNAGGGIAGSDENWGGYPASGVSGQSWRPIGLLIANGEHFTVDGIRVKSTNMWGIECEQSRFGKIINIDLDQDGRVENQDGINLRRGCHDILIENVIGITYDDIVAVTNITLSSDLDVLGTTVYDPIQTTLDCFNIVIRNISSRQERLFPNFSPPHYGGGILLLCEDGLKIYNVTVDGVTNRRAHFYIGYTSLQYWVTTQAAYGDMYNISVSNCYSPIYIRRPLKDCSFTHVAKYDLTNVNKSVAIPDSSQNVLRKYTSANFEWFATIPSFTPTSIANCGQWFDANDSGSFSLSSGLVNQWNDKSGNARHITASGTARPLYSAAVGAGINNRAGVLFDGTTDALRAAKITAYQNIAGFTIFMVGGRPSGVPNGGSVVFHGFDANNRTQLLNNFTDNIIYAALSKTTDAYGTLTVGSQTLIQTTYAFDGSLSGNSNRLRLRVNGQQFTPSYTGTVGTVTENHASSKFALGCIDFASPVYIPGSVAEVIIYERALTSAEILQVEAYLEAKWAM